MQKSDLKKQIFTIPNIITYFRIAAIPVFMYFTLAASTYILKSEAFPLGFPLIGFIIMFLAAASDVCDGFIARRFKMTSDLGIILDPFADKLMHMTAVLSLVIIGSIHWAFIVLIAIKEICMIIGAFVLVNKSKLIKANMLGKVASAMLSLAVFMSYFHAFWAKNVFYLDWIVLGVGVVITYCAFVNYILQAIKIVKDLKAAKLNNGDSSSTPGESAE